MRILVTAGPTREYLDEVRYLSNASSGRMGYALAAAALGRGHEVILVSGPVALPVPNGAELICVTTAAQMHQACVERFAQCNGVIAAAAVCDYRPAEPVAGKIKKTGEPLTVTFVENPDILAELGRRRSGQWLVGFAVEAHDALAGARQKLQTKKCDAIVLNAPEVIGSDQTHIDIISCDGQIAATFDGPKNAAAERILDWIERNLGMRDTP